MKGRAVAGFSLLAMLTVYGCSNGHTMKKEDLESSARELISIAEESQFFIAFVAEGHASAQYASNHPEYLIEQAKSAMKNLLEAKPAPDVQESDLQSLRRIAQRLNEATQALKPLPPNTQQLKADLADVVRQIRKIGLVS